MDVKLIDARVCSQENGENQIILTAEVRGYDKFISIDGATDTYNHFVKCDVDWFVARRDLLHTQYDKACDKMMELLRNIEHLPGEFDSVAQYVDDCHDEYVDNEVMIYVLTTRKAATWFGVPEK